MSEDQEMRSGGNAADESAEDEVKAHVKANRGMAGDDGDGDDEVKAHVKSSRS